MDGAEIREAVLTLLAIDTRGAKATIFAPDIDQHHVVNHLTGEEQSEVRNVLVESARIARGKVEDISKIDLSKLDAIILPGGFGVAKNLSTLAFDGANGKINEQLNKLLNDAIELQKPIGAICISPAVICLGIGDKMPSVTIGNNDDGTAGAITTLGGSHHKKGPDEINVDEVNKIVSTPAYMYDDANISDIAIGIDLCVQKIIELS